MSDKKKIGEHGIEYWRMECGSCNKKLGWESENDFGPMYYCDDCMDRVSKEQNQ